MKKTWKAYLPLGLLILFELAVGILLFIRPEEFTRAVVIGFGVLLLAASAVSFVRYFSDRRAMGEGSVLTLFLAVFTLALGGACAFLPGWVLGLFALAAAVYGVILVVAGLFKLAAYIDRRQAGWHPSVLSLIGAVLSVALGLLILINPFTARDVVWQVAGVSLIVEAVFDTVGLVGSLVGKQ